ncbi:sel1 repeat family protein [Desulfovibrio sp. ZJ200]|uniref:sel1 repeat family protein n=1 Tax=Desulfovibrio sp. ZJ200 TaxID=2709792 RepID=UPI0013EBF176|nr:sel1 repeat family protein [Desulfovibrio sp. ZJ200]
MRATLTADPMRGPGYGLIEVQGAGHMPNPVFVIYRSDGKSLSGGGWQESESTLRPDAWENKDGILRLAVGPAVVNEMDNLESYRLSLPGPGLCPLVVQNLVYSHMGGGQGIGARAPRPDPAPVQPQASPGPGPEPEPEPSPAPEPVETPPAPMEEPLQLPSQSSAKKQGRTGLLAGLLLLLLLAAGALWWFVWRAPDATPLPPVPPQTSEGAARNTPSGPSALALAREQLRGEARPEVSLALAKPLRKADASAEEGDAAFLLLEDAAQKGNAEAMLLVGQFYDPVSALPRGSIPVDISQARRWYDMALAKGQAEARAALDKLRAHVRAAADKGDVEARSLLQTWK